MCNKLVVRFHAHNGRQEKSKALQHCFINTARSLHFSRPHADAILLAASGRSCYGFLDSACRLSHRPYPLRTTKPAGTNTNTAHVWTMQIHNPLAAFCTTLLIESCKQHSLQLNEHQPEHCTHKDNATCGYATLQCSPASPQALSKSTPPQSHPAGHISTLMPCTASPSP